MARCFQCSAEIPEGQEVPAESGNSSFVFCPRCAPAGAGKPTSSPAAPATSGGAQATATATAPAVPLPKTAAKKAAAEDKPNMIGAIIVGLLAAALAAFVWFKIVTVTNFYIGYLAIGIGFVVGLGVMAGSGWHKGLVLQLLSAVITLFAMVTSEYLIMHHLFAKSLIAEGETAPSLLDGLVIAFPLIGHSIKEDPILLLFWAIAVFVGFRMLSENADDESD